MNKFLKHLHTVNQHRRMVRKLCFKCGLYKQGLLHDLSKYSPVEFINGVKFYTGTGSPHIGERKHYGYSKAWLNHKGKNKHHAEYWQDICSDGFTHPIPMPEEYFVEMLCDRVAASMIYLGDKFTAAALGGLVANTSNCSERFIGWSTKWGDSVGDFAPLADYTVEEVLNIGKELGIPDELLYKTPEDGLTGKNDEDAIGVEYALIDQYIRCREKPDSFNVCKKIHDMNKASEHKRIAFRIPHPMPKLRWDDQDENSEWYF